MAIKRLGVCLAAVGAVCLGIGGAPEVAAAPVVERAVLMSTLVEQWGEALGRSVVWNSADDVEIEVMEDVSPASVEDFGRKMVGLNRLLESSHPKMEALVACVFAKAIVVSEAGKPSCADQRQ